ncbi:MAG: helix-turn-helix transcriptional regulator [Ruminococcus sp.]|nr:helix-turn-helix transcriptional regulator [Ruminococcus sp.]
MSVIGKEIKKYRTAKGITQEELGQLVGVSTQAVSKWEHGGTPDVELLPQLAQILGVSIDALFGIEEESMAVSLARQICQMPIEEAYRYAFKICWAIEVGLTQDITMFDDVFFALIDNSAITTDKSDYFAKILTDGGVADTRLTQDFHHFFLMVEPKEGLKNKLADPETLRKVFEVFANEKLLRIIFYMYSRLNTPIATSLISKNTGLDSSEVDHCMDILCKNNLATRNVIATADGEMYSYMYHQESSVIPFLCFADEIAKKDFRDLLWNVARTKPFLYSTDS